MLKKFFVNSVSSPKYAEPIFDMQEEPFSAAFLLLLQAIHKGISSTVRF